MSEDKDQDEVDALKWETHGPIAVITLNRPHAMNSFSLESMRENRERLKEFEANDDLRVLIYTGEGRAFSTGIDIRKAPDFLYWDAEIRDSYWTTPHSLGVTKPTIAAVNGYAFGGGLELALGCDMRIFADNAKVGLPEAKLGALPGGGGTQTLPRLVGMGDALMMMLTGEPVTSDDALRMGLAQKVVPADDLMDEAMKVAEAICDSGQVAVKLIKEVAAMGIKLPLQEALWLEQVYFQRGRILAEDEITARIKAFGERSAKKK